ncbi:methyltransferase domain-containing protein [Candidatus Woesearchaeota archaeon]|nr:methyltransferase domain-containing protein [Candidatus Woesearchaeota archaeon]
MKAKKEIKDLYDSYSDFYGEVYKSKAGRFFMKQKLKCLHSFSKFSKEHKVLEIGCADGCYTQHFRDFNITAVDLSPKNIDVAKKKYIDADMQKDRAARIIFKVGDVEGLVFKDNSFDRVFSFSTLRYLDSLKKALSEIYRVTRPGGEVILDFPNKYNPWFGCIKPLLTGQTHIHDHHYSVGQIVRYMKKAGFRNVKVDTILFMPKNVKDKWFWLFKIFDDILSIWPFRKLGAIIMVKGIKQMG